MTIEKERDKYIRAYQLPNYRMGDQRKASAILDVKWAIRNGCNSMLDVGCGRGEMLDFARTVGVYAMGVEIVPELTKRSDVIQGNAASLTKLFEKHSFDVVTCFDVLEHIPKGIDVEVLEQLALIAKKAIVVTANNNQSRNGDDDLHINIRPYKEWHSVITSVLTGCHVERFDHTYSPTWRAIRAI